MGRFTKSNINFFTWAREQGLAFGELAKHLSEYHIVSFDLPGHGYAKALEEEKAYFPSNLIEDIEETINQQIWNTSYYLIGHSFGADLALHYAAKYPQRIKGIILLDGGYLSSQDLGMTLENELQGIEKFCNEVRFSLGTYFLNQKKKSFHVGLKSLKKRH